MSTSNPQPAAPLPSVNLGWALATLLRAYQKQVETALSDLPGGARGFLVMSLVHQETCQSQIALAERIGLDKTTLTYLIDGLESAGLVTRTPDPNDRRTRHINLTPEGTRTLAVHARVVEGVERDVLSRLSVDEAEQFQNVLLRAAGLSSGRTQDETERAQVCSAALGPADAC